MNELLVLPTFKLNYGRVSDLAVYIAKFWIGRLRSAGDPGKLIVKNLIASQTGRRGHRRGFSQQYNAMLFYFSTQEFPSKIYYTL